METAAAVATMAAAGVETAAEEKEAGEEEEEEEVGEGSQQAEVHLAIETEPQWPRLQTQTPESEQNELTTTTPWDKHQHKRLKANSFWGGRSSMQMQIPARPSHAARSRMASRMPPLHRSSPPFSSRSPERKNLTFLLERDEIQGRSRGIDRPSSSGRRSSAFPASNWERKGNERRLPGFGGWKPED